MLLSSPGALISFWGSLRSDLGFLLLGILFLLIKLALLLSRGILVLLVLGHQVVHVALGLGELHLIHTLASVPMQESLAPEHGGELLRDALEQLLDGGAVADEGDGHLQTTWWNVTDGGLHVVGDPFDEVAAVTGIAGSHHVLGIEHLLGQLWDSQGTVLLASTGGEGSESGHEEVETGEGHHVDGEFSEISIQLAGESEAGGHSR